MNLTTVLCDQIKIEFDKPIEDMDFDGTEFWQAYTFLKKRLGLLDIWYSREEFQQRADLIDGILKKAREEGK